MFFHPQRFHRAQEVFDFLLDAVVEASKLGYADARIMLAQSVRAYRTCEIRRPIHIFDVCNALGVVLYNANTLDPYRVPSDRRFDCLRYYVAQISSESSLIRYEDYPRVEGTWVSQIIRRGVVLSPTLGPLIRRRECLGVPHWRFNRVIEKEDLLHAIITRSAAVHRRIAQHESSARRSNVA